MCGRRTEAWEFAVRHGGIRTIVFPSKRVERVRYEVLASQGPAACPLEPRPGKPPHLRRDRRGRGRPRPLRDVRSASPRPPPRAALRGPPLGRPGFGRGRSGSGISSGPSARRSGVFLCRAPGPLDRPGPPSPRGCEGPRPRGPRSEGHSLGLPNRVGAGQVSHIRRAVLSGRPPTPAADQVGSVRFEVTDRSPGRRARTVSGSRAPGSPGRGVPTSRPDDARAAGAPEGCPSATRLSTGDSPAGDAAEGSR